MNRSLLSHKRAHGADSLVCLSRNLAHGLVSTADPSGSTPRFTHSYPQRPVAQAAVAGRHGHGPRALCIMTRIAPAARRRAGTSGTNHWQPAASTVVGQRTLLQLAPARPASDARSDSDADPGPTVTAAAGAGVRSRVQRCWCSRSPPL
jgi:hypothetical protein